MKKIMLLASAFIAFNASAEMNYITCDFSQETGLKFRFLQIEPETRFKNRELGAVYPYWVDSRFNPINIEESSYSFKQAKLSTDYFYAREEPKGVGKATSIVRYYKATTEGCDVIWARIDESDEYFKKSFDKENHMMDGDINWKNAEDVLGIQINDEMLKLKASIGHKYSVRAFNDGSHFKGKLTSQEREVEINDHELLEIVDVYPSMYVFKGKKRGSVTLKIKRESGQILLVPWDPERLSYKDLSKGSSIRAKYFNSILQGKINFGMNTDEVEASWGRPEKKRFLPLHKNKNGAGRFLKSDFYPYSQIFIKRQVSDRENRKPAGYYEEWYYDKRLPSKQTLVFDDAGYLNKEEQTKMLQKNNVYIPVPLDEIK